SPLTPAPTTTPASASAPAFTEPSPTDWGEGALAPIYRGQGPPHLVRSPPPKPRRGGHRLGDLAPGHPRPARLYRDLGRVPRLGRHHRPAPRPGPPAPPHPPAAPPGAAPRGPRPRARRRRPRADRPGRRRRRRRRRPDRHPAPGPGRSRPAPRRPRP